MSERIKRPDGPAAPRALAEISRRRFLAAGAAMFSGATGMGGYAFAYEPAVRLVVERHRLAVAGWPSRLRLRLAVVADLHACEPWMGVRRIREIVERTNGLGADAVLLLGDYDSRHRFRTGDVPADDWASALADLSAPLGVHAVLGNHDWWHDRAVQRRGGGVVYARRALERAGIPVYENESVRLEKGSQGFWLAGLGDQLALRPDPRRRRFVGVDDMSATLAGVADEAPVILMAHEPDIFPRVPERVSLTVCGHTHGGQVRLFGYSPVVPSAFGNRYAWGHFVERGRPGGAERHLVVSGGLGCSIAPVRFGVPPEITLVDVGAAPLV